jgi:hypothetical protein
VAGDWEAMMAALVDSREIGQAVCEALGVDINATRKITLTLCAGEIVFAEIEQMPEQEAVEKVIKVLKAYRWKESE